MSHSHAEGARRWEGSSATLLLEVLGDLLRVVRPMFAPVGRILVFLNVVPA